MTRQSSTRVCCKCVAAGKLNEGGLGICNLLHSDRWLLNSARCRAWNRAPLSFRTCLGLLSRYSLQRIRWRMCQPELVSSMSGSISSPGNSQRFLVALLSTDPPSFGYLHFHPLPCAGLWCRLLLRLLLSVSLHPDCLYLISPATLLE